MEYDLIVSDITSEDHFSYSCSKLQILSEIRNKSDLNPNEGKPESTLFKQFIYSFFKEIITIINAFDLT
jgi:hypothetical protein